MNARSKPVTVIVNGGAGPATTTRPPTTCVPG